MEGMWAVTKIDLNNRKWGVSVSYDGTSGAGGGGQGGDACGYQEIGLDRVKFEMPGR